jgi:hypothetical protein
MAEGTLPLPEPVGGRCRHLSEPGMIGHYPWTYAGAERFKRLPPKSEHEALFTADQVRAYAAQTVAQERERIAASLQPPAIPAGWRLVPEEATAEMLEASHHWLSSFDMRLCWRYVLHAAPQPPSAPPPSAGEEPST